MTYMFIKMSLFLNIGFDFSYKNVNVELLRNKYIPGTFIKM